MPRIEPIQNAEATGKAKQLLDGVQAKLGITPNLMKTLAHAPAALEAYLGFMSTLAAGQLNAKYRESLALAIAQANSCEYCLSAHTALGKMAGIDAGAIAESRRARSSDLKLAALLKLAQTLVVSRGLISDAAFNEARAAGLSDGEITEVIAHVALNTFTNYFNHVAQTEVDFPKVEMAS